MKARIVALALQELLVVFERLVILPRFVFSQRARGRGGGYARPGKQKQEGEFLVAQTSGLL
jgi:hypothetical protein